MRGLRDDGGFDQRLRPAEVAVVRVSVSVGRVLEGPDENARGLEEPREELGVAGFCPGPAVDAVELEAAGKVEVKGRRGVDLEMVRSCPKRQTLMFLRFGSFAKEPRHRAAKAGHCSTQWCTAQGPRMLAASAEKYPEPEPRFSIDSRGSSANASNALA